MSKQQDFVFLSKLMANANMGWWEANLATECYTCSEYISEILNLDETGTISFEDFNKRILNEEQGPTTVRSFDVQSMSEVVYLLKTPKGSVWMRSKICFREVDDKGNTIVYGIAEMQDGPDTAIACQALQRSERLLHNIYKNLPVGIELYNKEGVLVDLNDKELDLFHVDSKEELLGINIFENPVFPEEMKERLRNNEDADFTFRYDFSKLGEYYSNNKAEGTIDLVTKVTTLYDENHNPVNYLLINADKTETTVAYNKIQEFEEFFELIGDYAKVGYAHFNILSKQGHAQKSWYKNIGEESGTPLSEIIGTYKSFHPDDRDLILQFFEEVQKGNADKLSHKIRVFRENGECTWTHVNLFVRKYAPQDKVIELISINYDITDLKQIEEMLVNERDRAEASDRLKSAFLANMSHEIRTPLNAIVGFSSLLASAENVVEKELYNSLISHNNELLLNLINDIIDLSKIEAGYLELHQNWFNLTELLDECVAEYARLLPSGVELLTSYPEHDALVELDKLRIKQILNNFLSNALKNTIRGYVEVFYEIDKHCVRIGVKDTGRGIPQNMLEKIFERFEKVDSFAQGVGLGLSICKSIVDKMNGRIQVYSQLGLGTTFIAELPCHSILVNE
ncbi:MULTISPECIES: PAS domain-containing sensor histidine kinase [Bacteroides]|uniref:histidine kinase n=1 Tax=Bacteroides caccae TaxID=47678 RepID=A0AAW7WJE8_9BACE|nr:MULTISPECIES: PAS domain-containing sensor histidine kinase [Bacteroides]KAA5452308.1 PAS domain-containing sensor histidine kinase [Bacteroides caccae]KAA5453212.1 PAS domain-containing sensor histidine kinase [Bacteroides caccae]KAA5459255.1 PAS domain-containing sensor histidine kinase [Bacteroides caccae]KAA5473647.1 PAS domain-containing sensor histidine kinase [Bacteroides caccae]MBE6277993.1 PAS domain-containing sensor histidine kinase [Bacteroides sp.]